MEHKQPKNKKRLSIATLLAIQNVRQTFMPDYKPSDSGRNRFRFKKKRGKRK